VAHEVSRHIYRCNRCRTRNAFHRRVSDYIIKRKCRDCGHQRFYVDKERVARKPCYCGGYHHAHRPGSRCCEHHPLHIAYRAQRAGADHDEVQDLKLDATLDKATKTRPWRHALCPF
jgi:hypothetical protein